MSFSVSLCDGALNNLDGRCLGDCSSQSNQIKIISKESETKAKLMKAQRKSSSQTRQAVGNGGTGAGAANKFEKINQYGKIYVV